MNLKAPFPWFGGKSAAAATIWSELGDPGGYIEPFAGSAATLLARPHQGRRRETINDLNGWLTNTWRSIQLSPQETLKHARGVVTEIDYHARAAWLQERDTPDLASWLEGHPEAHDPKAAGWWIYAAAWGIRQPWSRGPWEVVDGHLRKTGGDGISRSMPNLAKGGAGMQQVVEPDLGALAQRLRHVRIACGDWRRVLTPVILGARIGGDGTAVLLDPPYSGYESVYVETDADISASVRAWCLSADPQLRIVLCGYGDEHAELEQHGWRREQSCSTGGGYTAGVPSASRERIWCSPACLGQPQESLFST